MLMKTMMTMTATATTIRLRGLHTANNSNSTSRRLCKKKNRPRQLQQVTVRVLTSVVHLQEDVEAEEGCHIRTIQDGQTAVEAEDQDLHQGEDLDQEEDVVGRDVAVEDVDVDVLVVDRCSQGYMLGSNTTPAAG
jgi:hypothetical protein